MDIKKYFTKDKIFRTLIQSFTGCILWTIFLTPYMLFIIGISMTQYVSWFSMQWVLVPFIAPVVFYLTTKIEKTVMLKLSNCNSAKEGIYAGNDRIDIGDMKNER